MIVFGDWTAQYPNIIYYIPDENIVQLLCVVWN